MRPIFLDHHSTTPVRPEVLEAMQRVQADSPGNPASAHTFGRAARRELNVARERIAARLGASAEEVVFTSGATEANNLAVFGLAGEPPGHVITSMIEHPCVVEPVARLAALGFAVKHLSVSPEGFVDTAVLPIRNDTRVVCLMLVNHETGAIQPAIPPGRTAWHCDAAQAVGKRPIHFHQLGATTLALSGHKFGAPAGIGALLVRSGTQLRPRLFGGHQQDGRRPGTEPVALAVALATALDLACDDIGSNGQFVRGLRQRLIDRLTAGAAPVVVNGPANAESFSPYVANIAFPGVRADAALIALDLAGVACSTGSACSSGSLLPSPVLTAMGVRDEVVRSSLRFSFSPQLDAATVDEAADRIIAVVRRLRGLPFG